MVRSKVPEAKNWVQYLEVEQARAQRTEKNLRDKELGETLRKPALLTGEDHLQHVPVQFLHHHEYLLRSLKHALEVHNPGVP